MRQEGCGSLSVAYLVWLLLNIKTVQYFDERKTC